MSRFRFKELVGATRFEPATSSTPWKKLRVQTQFFASLNVSRILRLALQTERLLRDHGAYVELAGPRSSSVPPGDLMSPYYVPHATVKFKSSAQPRASKQRTAWLPDLRYTLAPRVTVVLYWLTWTRASRQCLCGNASAGSKVIKSDHFSSLDVISTRSERCSSAGRAFDANAPLNKPK